MVSQSLIEYIKKYSPQYSREALTKYLVEQGYSLRDVDQAFSVALQGKKTGLKKTALMLGIIIIVLLVAYVVVDFIAVKEAEINLFITLESEIEAQTLQPITISIISSSDDELSGKIKVSATDPENSFILNRDELVAFAKEKDFVIEVNIGKYAKLGRYAVKAELESGNKKVEKTAYFTVVEKIPERQKPVQPVILRDKCLIKCDDLDPCTADSCVNGQCVYTRKIPCCGNQKCEESQGESVLNCPNDCRTEHQRTNFDILQEAVNDAEKNPDRAAKTCLQVVDADKCILELYQKTKNKDFCKGIIDVAIQGNCYLDNVLRTNDFSSCDLIKEEFSQKNCYSYKQVKEAT